MKDSHLGLNLTKLVVMVTKNAFQKLPVIKLLLNSPRYIIMTKMKLIYNIGHKK